MPEFIKKALKKKGLTLEYQNRPPYQKNDYIGWITRVKREETRQKRLNQMLDELKKGNLYMKMDYKPQRIQKK
ncbi:YdeI/OmpD-associated family protein [Patescibacteria group bacterium]|nr:YdeI/OmpD-associated family protein [Patescibacteria group bacterium]MBU1075210.1 YdeI/OmpD-associated family protein [Patescibacteria group bacterium]MBU1951770.1 YdeI/OmpD-associated family protein [Patescibacteria group bacterium]MBU2229307.1 YdeI/OmpD-associated family protein [Patescibacteria group bacterium]MBU2235733.1 YdeI/OmpD-associated family protein [Patescibacteria group bacterium]